MLLLPLVGDKTRKGRVDKTGLIRGVMGHSIGVVGSGFGYTQDVRPLSIFQLFLERLGGIASETGQHYDSDRL